MNQLDKDYQHLLEYIIRFGSDKQDRTGVGTKSIFGWNLRHNMQSGFPLLTTKKVHFKSVITELLWFMSGDTNILYLLENDCHIWDGDAYKNYLLNKESMVIGAPNLGTLTKEWFINKIKTDDEFAKQWGNLGPIYGAQWRKWKQCSVNSLIEEPKSIDNKIIPGKEISNIKYIDQIQNIINLLKTDPDSRRMIVNAWNVGELDQMVLPPCHYSFQFYTRKLTYKERYRVWFNNNYETGFEYNDEHEIDFSDPYWVPTPERAISLMWNQRSVDVFLGLPFNIASYGLLLLMFADEFGMMPEDLIGNLGDCHLYNNHIGQANEQITRIPFQLPRVTLQNGLNSSTHTDIILEDYISHPTIKAPLNN